MALKLTGTTDQHSPKPCHARPHHDPCGVCQYSRTKGSTATRSSPDRSSPVELVGIELGVKQLTNPERGPAPPPTAGALGAATAEGVNSKWSLFTESTGAV